LIRPPTPNHPLSKEAMLLRWEIQDLKFWLKPDLPPLARLKPMREMECRERLAYCEKRLEELKANS
jgi:hypothetical protein